MLAHYGVDVLDRRVSLRRIHVLLQRLPAGAWPDPDSPLSWSIESHLLAALVDSVGALIYVTLKAAGSKSAKQPRPVPRPKVPPRPPVAVPRTSGGPSPWVTLARTLAGQKGSEVTVVNV